MTLENEDTKGKVHKKKLTNVSFALTCTLRTVKIYIFFPPHMLRKRGNWGGWWPKNNPKYSRYHPIKLTFLATPTYDNVSDQPKFKNDPN